MELKQGDELLLQKWKEEGYSDHVQLTNIWPNSI